jgi:hypothetical protein
MEITFLRTGGIIPITKKSNTIVDWSETEVQELLSLIRADNMGQMRDETQYQLVYNDQTVAIDIDKVPKKYKKTFERLKEDLRIVKPG